MDVLFDEEDSEALALRRPAVSSHAFVATGDNPSDGSSRSRLPRIRDQGPSDRQHLLLAPAQARSADAPSGRKARGKGRKPDSASIRSAKSLPGVGQDEVLLYGRGTGKSRQTLRHVAEAASGDMEGLETVRSSPFDQDATGARRGKRQDRPEKGGLAHAVPSEDRDALASNRE